MQTVHILVTMPRNAVFHTFFNEERMHELEAVGQVHWNETDRQYTHAELCEKMAGIDVCVTGWGTPQLDEEVMAHADRLRLVAHMGGSVNGYVSPAVYAKGARVVSGNEVFAESVAESVVAYALASLRRIPYYSNELARGNWVENFNNRGLLDRSVGIVGYGMISRYVVPMLRVFHCPVKVFSRHIRPEEVERQQMSKAGLEEIFSTCDVVSLHSGMTPDNYHMITEALLERLKPGALLINTARGALVDEAALARTLARRPDLTAALDVYETEPLPADSPLVGLPNVLLMPHQGGPTIDRRLIVTRSVIADIRHFLAGEPMNCEISQSYAAKMSSY